jgi:hypothetical protein
MHNIKKKECESVEFAILQIIASKNLSLCNERNFKHEKMGTNTIVPFQVRQ